MQSIHGLAIHSPESNKSSRCSWYTWLHAPFAGLYCGVLNLAKPGGGFWWTWGNFGKFISTALSFFLYVHKFILYLYRETLSTRPNHSSRHQGPSSTLLTMATPSIGNTYTSVNQKLFPRPSLRRSSTSTDGGRSQSTANEVSYILKDLKDSSPVFLTISPKETFAGNFCLIWKLLLSSKKRIRLV